MPYARHSNSRSTGTASCCRERAWRSSQATIPELPVTAAAHARWRGLLAWLCARNACDAERATALRGLAGAGRACPVAGCPWPVARRRVAGARAGRVQRHGTGGSAMSEGGFPCRDNCRSAKAYFGFGRLWRVGPVCGTRVRATPSAARSASRGARIYLLSATGARRPLEGFPSRPGWERRMGKRLRRGGSRTQRRTRWPVARAQPGPGSQLRADAGWGFSPLYSADADSTLWALRLAAVLGAMRAPRARAALSFMRRHRKRDGGVATFLPETLARQGCCYGATCSRRMVPGARRGHRRGGRAARIRRAARPPGCCARSSGTAAGRPTGTTRTLSPLRSPRACSPAGEARARGARWPVRALGRVARRA